MKIQLVTDRRTIEVEAFEPITALAPGERVITIRNPTGKPIGPEVGRWLIDAVAPLM